MAVYWPKTPSSIVNACNTRKMFPSHSDRTVVVFFEKNCPKIGPYFGKPIKENMCMGNTMKSCIFEISRLFLHRFKYTNFSLYDIRKYFQKYNWKYHLSAVLGVVIKCQKSTGSAWETLHYKKLYF